jgi:hypothetical protein
MSKIAALTAIVLFVWLAIYSYQHKAQAYAGNAEFSALLDRESATKLHGKAAKMADLWQLSEADIAAPVELFGEGVQ